MAKRLLAPPTLLAFPREGHSCRLVEAFGGEARGALKYGSGEYWALQSWLISPSTQTSAYMSKFILALFLGPVSDV